MVLVTMQLAKFVSLCVYVYTSAERQDKHRKPLYYHLLGTIYIYVHFNVSTGKTDQPITSVKYPT